MELNELENKIESLSNEYKSKFLCTHEKNRELFDKLQGSEVVDGVYLYNKIVVVFDSDLPEDEVYLIYTGETSNKDNNIPFHIELI